MPGRIERTSGARKSPVCIFRERAASASSRVCLAQAMTAIANGRAVHFAVEAPRFLGLYLRVAYPGYRSYGTSGYKDAEQGESAIHTHMPRLESSRRKDERTRTYTAAQLKILGAR